MTKQTVHDVFTNRVTFLSLKGQLHNGNAQSFKKSIFNIPEHKDFLILDLTNLHSISGEGIKVFVESIRYFRSKKGTIVLIQPGEEVYLLLQFLQLSQYVKIATNYEEAKEYIESLVENGQGKDFNIEEKKWDDVIPDGREQRVRNIDTEHSATLNRAAEEKYGYSGAGSNIEKEYLLKFDVLKDNINGIKDQLHRITRKLEKREIPYEKIYEFFENKISEIKNYNERRFSEFRERLDALQENQQGIRKSLQDFKEELAEIRNLLLEKYSSLSFREPLYSNQEKNSILEETTKRQDGQEETPGKLDTYELVICRGCGQYLRVFQTGRHICPKCKTEFNVLPDGSVKFFDSR